MVEAKVATAPVGLSEIPGAIHYLVFLLGLKARLAGYEQRFQSNSLEHKRALSLWRLGVEYLYRYGQEEESASLIEIEFALRREVHQQAQDLGRI